MNKDVKDLWVKALRGNTFKRGHFQMHNLDDQYDVLGVLCAVAVAEKVISAPEKRDKAQQDRLFFGYLYGAENAGVGLPKEVYTWAEIDYRVAYSLAVRTDNKKAFKDWNAIADYIEKTF